MSVPLVVAHGEFVRLIPLESSSRTPQERLSRVEELGDTSLPRFMEQIADVPMPPVMEKVEGRVTLQEHISCKE